jgi:hypothetical protein
MESRLKANRAALTLYWWPRASQVVGPDAREGAAVQGVIDVDVGGDALGAGPILAGPQPEAEVPTQSPAGESGHNSTKPGLTRMALR